MKRTLLCILSVLIALPLFVSCRVDTQTEYVPDGYDVSPTQYHGAFRSMIDTPSRIIFQSNDVGLLVYYSKIDGKTYLFSADPLDRGSDDNSPASKFVMMDNNEYCNGRLYCAVGGVLYSVKTDATEAKKVYSAGVEEIGGSIYFSMTHYKQYLFFKLLGDDGEYSFCRFDTVKKEFINLTKDKDYSVGSFFFGNDCIYFKKLDESYYYKADLELNYEHELDSSAFGVFDGKHIYGNKMSRDGDTTVYEGIFRENIETGEYEVFYSAEANLRCEILYISEDSIYFTRNDGEGPAGAYQRLYRIPKSGGEPELIFDDADTDIYELYLTNAGIFAFVQKYEENGSCDTFCARFITDENGRVTDLERLRVTG